MKKLLLGSVFTVLFALTSAASASEVLVLGYDGTCCNSGDPNQNVHNFYNSLSGHTSTLGGTVVTSAALSGIELLWAVQQSDPYTAAEIAAMTAYLSSGGRIAFMGEHGTTFGANENNQINAALAALGSAMSIQNGNIKDPSDQVALRSNGEILTHTLTTGVDAYHYAAFAPILNAAEILMLGHDLSSVMMGFENIGAGSIFLITDQNVFDPSRLIQGDNQRMFENLLLADTGAPPPPPQCGQPGQPDCPALVPVSSTIPLIGLGLALLGLRRIRHS